MAGFDMLVEGLTEANPPASAPAAEAPPPAPAAANEAPPSADAPAPSDPPAAPAAPVVSPTLTGLDVLNHPMFKQNVDREVNARLTANQEAQRLAQYNTWLESLPDDQYGQVMRYQQAEAARYSSTKDAVTTQFAEQATREVLQEIKEFGTLNTAELEKLDPANYKSYGKWVSAVADVAADRRAGGLAEKKLKAEVEAEVTRRVAEVAKSYPQQPSARGATTASPISDNKSRSGSSLLREYFSEHQ